MSVVIAGCGDLGTEAGLRFAALGHRVLGLRRAAQLLPDRIEGQSVDLAVRPPVLPADTDVVVIATSADRRTTEAYRRAYVDSVRNVLTALGGLPQQPARVLFVSSTAVYGVDDGRWVDESSPAAPASPTGEVLREAEELLHAQRPDAIVLRLSGIYGPGRTGLLDRVREQAAIPPAAPAYTNRIHRDDAAAAIVHLCTGVAAPDTVYLGSDDAPADRREVIEFLARQLGVPVPSAAAGNGTAGKRCRNTRLRDTGFAFSYPSYREGYRAVLDGVGVRHR